MSSLQIQHYPQFMFAREFLDAGDFSKQKEYKTNLLEKIGNALLLPFAKPMELAFRKITHPVTIIALTALMCLVVTLIFYPSITASITVLSQIKPWMIKLGLYICIQLSVLGLGVRGLGRIQNNALVSYWNNKQCAAIMPGTYQVRLRE